jgi:hypothetical protein
MLFSASIALASLLSLSKFAVNSAPVVRLVSHTLLALPTTPD